MEFYHFIIFSGSANFPDFKNGFLETFVNYLSLKACLHFGPNRAKLVCFKALKKYTFLNNNLARFSP
jgi:hypothetical protein